MEQFYRLRDLPKMGTEIELINAMINVLTYEHLSNPVPNKVVIANAHSILATKVNELYKVINNPTREKFSPIKDSDLFEEE